MIFDQSDLELFRELVGSGQDVLISTHIHPDPDAIGSALAAAEIVEILGGTPTIILEDLVPIRCRFLPGASSVLSYPLTDFDRKFSSAVIVDAGSLSRIGNRLESRWVDRTESHLRT